jgi:hypothetical protein
VSGFVCASVCGVVGAVRGLMWEEIEVLEVGLAEVDFVVAISSGTFCSKLFRHCIGWEFVDREFVEWEFVDREFVEWEFVDREFVGREFVEWEFENLEFVGREFVNLEFVDREFVEREFVDWELGGRFSFGLGFIFLSACTLYAESLNSPTSRLLFFWLSSLLVSLSSFFIWFSSSLLDLSPSFLAFSSSFFGLSSSCFFGLSSSLISSSLLLNLPASFLLLCSCFWINRSFFLASFLPRLVDFLWKPTPGKKAGVLLGKKLGRKLGPMCCCRSGGFKCVSCCWIELDNLSK